MNCNISCALGYIARNYGILKERGYLRLVYDNKVYVIAKKIQYAQEMHHCDTPKVCIDIYISDRNTEIHHYEYDTYKVRWCSGWGILCRGSDQWLPAHCEACTLLVPYLLCITCLFVFFGISLVTSIYLPMRGVHPSRS